MNFFAFDFLLLRIMWFLIEKVLGERLCCWEICSHLNNITLYIASYLVSKQITSHYFFLLFFALWTKKVLKLASVQCFSTFNLLLNLWLYLFHHSFWCFMNFPFRNHFWYSYDFGVLISCIPLLEIMLYLICNLKYSWSSFLFSKALILTFEMRIS